MKKRKNITILIILVILLLVGVFVFKAIQNRQTRAWMENNMTLQINESSTTGYVHLADEDLPSGLKGDENIRNAHKKMLEALDAYNDEASDLNLEVDQLVNDLNLFGKDMYMRYSTIPLKRLSVDITWFGVQTQYNAYLSALQSYWIAHYSQAMPLVSAPNCDFVYTVEEVVPENTRIRDTGVLYGLSKRTCSYPGSTAGASAADAPAGQMENQAEKPTAQPTATTAPTFTPTPVPLYATSPDLSFNWGYTYDNGSTIYMVQGSGPGQKVIAYDLGQDINIRTVFKIEPSPLNEQDFIVSNDEQYVISRKMVWRTDTGEKVKEADFWELALAPDASQLIGYENNWGDGPSYPVNVYDFPGLNKIRNILLLEAPQSRSIEITRTGFSSTGKYFALIYMEKSIESNSADPVDSGLLVWDTGTWEQVFSLQGDGATLYDQAAFTGQDNFLAVGVKTFEPGAALYSPYSSVEIFNLSDPQAVTSLSYTMQTANVAALALGSRPDNQIAVACRMGTSQDITIEIVDTLSGQLVKSDTIEGIFWPWFTRSGIFYGTGYGTRQPYQVYLPTD